MHQLTEQLAHHQEMLRAIKLNTTPGELSVTHCQTHGTTIIIARMGLAHNYEISISGSSSERSNVSGGVDRRDTFTTGAVELRREGILVLRCG